MDKKDFYREIMSQYTFDEEKIRRNAKRRSSAAFFERGGRWLPLTSAAAVFVSVFSGYMLLSPVLNNTPITVPDNTQSPAVFSAELENENRLSASERLEKMENLVALYSSDKLGAEIKVMHVTFGKPMTSPELNLIINTEISDTGIVRIEALYNGGEFLSGTEYEADNETLFTAAKINAPAYLYVKLLEVFEFVDMTDSVTDENFEPLNKNTSTNKNEDITEPVITVTQAVQTAALPAETTEAATSAPETVQTAPVSETTAPPASETTQTEDDLPPLEVFSVIKIPAEGVVNIEFISDDYFLMLFRNKVSLYRIIRDVDILEYELISSYEAVDPAITYKYEKSKTFVILGSDSNSRRTSLFVADGVNNTLVEADVSSITQDAAITYAFCGGNRILLKTQSLETSRLYFAAKNNDGSFSFDLLHNTAQTVVLNFDETSFAYAVKYANEEDEEAYELFNYSFSELASYNLNTDADLKGAVSFVRSPDLSTFAINNGGKSWIWNSKSSGLSLMLDATIVKFSDYNSSVFTDGTNWYRLDGSEFEIISESEATALSVKPDFSSKYSVSEVTSDMVKIEVK